MRLFVGIALEDALMKQLARLCEGLRKHGDALRWSAQEGWHVTLQFLGNANAEQLDCLKLRLAEVRSALVPVHLGGLDVFERAGALVIEVALTDELVRLQKRVIEATTKCGFMPEERAYHPHITLARAKGDGRRQLKQIKAQIMQVPPLDSFTAREFLLYESHLGPGGSKYEVRGRFALYEAAKLQS
jgi:RNA 2',3'-cyclic 3'-phosphodiesterase